MVAPITKTKRGIPTHVLVPAGGAGLTFDSDIKCEELRSVSTDHLVRQLGNVTWRP